MGKATDNGGTTDEDYRWKWLATLFTAVYGLGYPAWVLFDLPLASARVDGATMGVLVLVWLGTVVYIIGPENLKAAEQLRG